MEKNRILWLDSVKGIACWVIFLGHFVFCYGFLPFVYRWVGEVKYNSFIYNGNTAMDAFVMISAFIEASVFLNAGEKFGTKAGSGIIKRYLRFSIPIFMIEVIVYVLQKAGLWTERFPAIPVRDIPFSEIIYDSFYLSLFKGSSHVYPVFWMMNVMFIGYILVLVICAMVSVMKKPCAYLLLTVLMIITLAQLSMFFLVFFGTFLYLFYSGMYVGTEEKHKNFKAVRYIFGAALVILSTYLSGQDSELAYMLSNKGFPKCFGASYFYCWISAAMLLTGLILCTPAIRVLNNRKLASLGKLCFPVFLFHPLCLVIFGEYVFRYFDARAGKYNHGTKAAFFVSFLTTLLLSLLYVKIIEPLINKLTQKIVKIL